MRNRCQHPLHQDIAVCGHWQVEPEELVLCVERDRCGSTQTEEMNLTRLNHQVDRMADRLGVDRLAGAVERRDGAAKNLSRIGLWSVIGLYGPADIGRATGETLCQLDFQSGVTGRTE